MGARWPHNGMVVRVVPHFNAFEMVSALISTSGQQRITDSVVLFRGMRCSDWELVPSALRAANRGKIHKLSGLPKYHTFDDERPDDLLRHCELEAHAILRFYSVCHRNGLALPRSAILQHYIHQVSFNTESTWKIFAEEWIPDDLLEAASLAQHYGVPTRLLDWTLDPFVACYFAASESCIGSSLAVWEFDVSRWTYSDHKKMKLVSPPLSGQSESSCAARRFHASPGDQLQRGGRR